MINVPRETRHDFSAQQRAAMATIALLIDGPQKAAELAAQLYDSDEPGWYLLNNLSQPLGLINDNGWWYVYASPFAHVRHLLATINDRLDETCEGMAYCRPLTRTDMVQLRALLLHLVKIGTLPSP